MSVKMDFRSEDLEKMESLVMKENHLRVTYGGTSVIVLTARKNALKKIGPRERKKPHNKSSKKDMKQEFQKLRA